MSVVQFASAPSVNISDVLVPALSLPFHVGSEQHFRLHPGPRDKGHNYSTIDNEHLKFTDT